MNPQIWLNEMLDMLEIQPPKTLIVWGETALLVGWTWHRERIAENDNRLEAL